ncbi:MAG: preprotein translocase subunit SecA, partial [Pseudomonadota bacterium]
LNALAAKGVHVVTVNDYLAQRDAGWMGRVYTALGLTVGCIRHGLTDDERRAAYACDVTYATNNELGFDYLRDNMKFRIEDMVQRGHAFAIVDEVDSILIDEARTPLIISGPTESSSEVYRAAEALMANLVEDDYEKDEKARAVTFTETGVEKFEELAREAGLLKQGGLYDLPNVSIVHHLQQALRANILFGRDKDYIVKDDKVIIIDEFTGRMMEGRRYSDGLHQALEAKEGVTIQNENQTLASITFQNYFRLYDKLSGMTGTAMTEANEFAEIYGLEVVEMPTNTPVARKDNDDEVYRTLREKDDALIQEIEAARERGQPVLVGTVSIEKSETLAALLKSKKVQHEVLNARHHEREAFIIAQAGAPGAVTIATNMAGRGTDIQLGGNVEMRVAELAEQVKDETKRAERETQIRAEVEEARAQVKAAGGLYVIATERHESRRIDNQLRGRSGRQGDPGASKFFLSLEDDLMRIFGSERMDMILRKLGIEDGEAIVHPWINKALEKAQSKVEARTFEIRKQLLKFDDVMNDQRKVVFEQRRDLMTVDSVAETVDEMREQVIDDMVAKALPEGAFQEQWDLDGLHEQALRLLGVDLPVKDWAAEEGVADVEIKDRIRDASKRHMAKKTADYGADVMRMAEKSLLLQVLDQIWKDHLLQLDHLRQGVHLRAYGQRDPLNEYKREAFALFEDMLDRVREQTVGVLSHLQIRMPDPASFAPEGRDPAQMRETRVDPAMAGAEADASTTSAAPRSRGRAAAGKAARPAVAGGDPQWAGTPRNAPCPCGSGKKYKQCHGRI